MEYSLQLVGSDCGARIFNLVYTSVSKRNQTASMNILGHLVHFHPLPLDVRMMTQHLTT